MEGLSREIVIKSIRDCDYDYVVDRLFDAARHICQKGSLAVELPSAEGQGKSGPKVYTEKVPENIVINVRGEKKIIHFKDCINDPFIDVVLEPSAYIRR